MTIFTTSDTHFDHENAITYCNRPFQNIVEMNDYMITQWNSIVKPKDTVIHVGDFAFANKKRVEQLLNILHGQKILVSGNHDRKEVRSAAGWSSIVEYKRLKINKKTFIFSHYPMLSWDKMSRGSIMLHGHCHGSLQVMIQLFMEFPIFDVGVDNWKFQPIPIETFIDLDTSYWS